MGSFHLFYCLLSFSGAPGCSKREAHVWIRHLNVDDTSGKCPCSWRLWPAQWDRGEEPNAIIEKESEHHWVLTQDSVCAGIRYCREIPFLQSDRVDSGILYCRFGLKAEEIGSENARPKLILKTRHHVSWGKGYLPLELSMVTASRVPTVNPQPNPAGNSQDSWSLWCWFTRPQPSCL